MTLDSRKRKILDAVVRDYVDTVRPVGSEDLAARHPWGVKSATIRNELAELSELGYLRQPHTSAGRIPSDQGYRFYVDHLMVVRDVSPATGAVGEEVTLSLELDALLRQTCALLTRTTSYTSVATPPRPSDTEIRQIFLSPIEDGRALLVVLLSTGQVENRLLPGLPELNGTDYLTLNNALNLLLNGKTLDAVTGPDAKPISAPTELAPALGSVFHTLLQAVRQTVQAAAGDDNVYLEGTSEILRQPEFRDTAKLDSVLETLQKRTWLLQTLSRALLGPAVTVIIGSENFVPAMQDCSVVTAPYYVGMRERGTIGVVGPTRMDYERAVPAVSFFAQSLTQTLSHFSSG